MIYIEKLKRDVSYFRALAGDTDTPRISKILIGAAVAYLVSPIDLIPDFIPLLGQLDDLIIVPALLWLAVAFVPEDVKRRAKRTVGADW